MTTVGLIPARGGSKRLPRKNILDLGGKPILAYPIEAALACGLFDCVYVSTEDSEIARVAENYGAAVITRPVEIAEDRSTVAQVCLHALEMLPEVDLICCIYATAVLLKPESIVEGYRVLHDQPETDFVMGVSEFEYSPVQALRENTDGYLSYMWPEWKGVQSQMHPRLLVSNGTFYWARRNPLLNQKTFYGARLRGIVMPDEEVCDIDTERDYQIALKKFNNRI
jgi:pseudaminic acid cytidylyltransferase